MKLNKNIKIFLNYILGPLLFAWLSYSIFKQIKDQPHLEESWQRIKVSFTNPTIIYLILVFLLMFVNWSLEAFKWKMSVQKVQPVSFFTALKAIFSGVSFSVTTPNRMGEYLGRVLYMNEGNRLRVISLTVLGSLSQLIITVFFGILALWVLRPSINQSGLSGWPAWINVLLTGSSVAFLFLTVFYFRIGWLIKWVDKIPVIKKYFWLINELGKTDTTLLMRLLSISLLRYFVFTTQYFFLFLFFGIEVSWWQGFWATGLVFYIMAITPTIALFEVVQKIYVTKEIFAIFTVNTLGIGFVTTTIWFINLVLPAAIGSLLILGIKFFKRNEAS
jgi:MFS family permease